MASSCYYSCCHLLSIAAIINDCRQNLLSRAAINVCCQICCQKLPLVSVVRSCCQKFLRELLIVTATACERTFDLGDLHHDAAHGARRPAHQHRLAGHRAQDLRQPEQGRIPENWQLKEVNCKASVYVYYKIYRIHDM